MSGKITPRAICRNAKKGSSRKSPKYASRGGGRKRPILNTYRLLEATILITTIAEIEDRPDIYCTGEDNELIKLPLPRANLVASCGGCLGELFGYIPPELIELEIDKIEQYVIEHGRLPDPPGPEELGEIVGVTKDVAQKLNITELKAIDETPEEWKMRKMQENNGAWEAH